MTQTLQTRPQYLYWFVWFWLNYYVDQCFSTKYCINKSAWMPVKGRQTLFARSKKEEKLFYCVGGKIEKGETDIMALKRETGEEVAVQLFEKTIRHLKTFYGPAPDGRPMRMACYDATGSGKPTPSSEVEEIDWFTSADKHRTTFMGVLILDWFHNNDFID